jgi:hypothetical protein
MVGNLPPPPKFYNRYETPIHGAPLRSSTKIVNFASTSTNLVNMDLVDLNCLTNFWWSGAENDESGAENDKFW